MTKEYKDLREKKGTEDPEDSLVNLGKRATKEILGPREILDLRVRQEKKAKKEKRARKEKGDQEDSEVRKVIKEIQVIRDLKATKDQLDHPDFLETKGKGDQGVLKVHKENRALKETKECKVQWDKKAIKVRREIKVQGVSKATPDQEVFLVCRELKDHEE